MSKVIGSMWSFVSSIVEYRARNMHLAALFICTDITLSKRFLTYHNIKSHHKIRKYILPLIPKTHFRCLSFALPSMSYASIPLAHIKKKYVIRTMDHYRCSSFCPKISNRNGKLKAICETSYTEDKHSLI